MKKFWRVMCVTLVLTAFGILLEAIRRFLWSQGEDHPKLMAFLAVLCVVAGMYILRKISRRDMLRASVIACWVSMLVSCLGPVILAREGMEGIWWALYVCIEVHIMLALNLLDVPRFGEGEILDFIKTMMVFFLPLVFNLSFLFRVKDKNAQEEIKG